MMNSFYRIKVTIIVFFLLLFVLNTSMISSLDLSSDVQPLETRSVTKVENYLIPHVAIIKQRLILYQQPISPAPDEGYPVLFLLHGASQYPFAWFFPMDLWSFHQSIFTKKALDQGFFIIAPSSGRPIQFGPHAWSSFIQNVSESEDLQLFQSLFSWIQNRSEFLDLKHVFCAGFSSGGFMSSRLAKVYPELLAGIAVHSGTDADSITFTNLGPKFDCESPREYPTDHPPALIIHGEKDRVVPFVCGLHYYHELQRNDINCLLLTDKQKGHIWLSSFSDEIINWFQSIS